MYTEKVMEHFKNPRNVGEIQNADGIGKVGNPVCGDMMEFYIKVKDNIIEDIKFKTFGCGAAIAVSSMVSEMAKGKTIEDAMKITNDMVAEELDGLPKNKMHCSNLGADALHKAIEDYQNKGDSSAEIEQGTSDDSSQSVGDREEDSNCPYCEKDIKENSQTCPYCEKQISKE